eukprot:jgi/Bigna1/136185/aug1.32_g10893
MTYIHKNNCFQDLATSLTLNQPEDPVEGAIEILKKEDQTGLPKADKMVCKECKGREKTRQEEIKGSGGGGGGGGEGGGAGNKEKKEEFLTVELFKKEIEGKIYPKHVNSLLNLHISQCKEKGCNELAFFTRRIPRSWSEVNTPCIIYDWFTTKDAPDVTGCSVGREMNNIVMELFPRGSVTEESKAMELGVLEQEVGTVTTETLQMAISRKGTSIRDINLLLHLHIKQCDFDGKRCCKIGTFDGSSPKNMDKDRCKIYNQVPSLREKLRKVLPEHTDCPTGIALNMIAEAAHQGKTK